MRSYAIVLATVLAAAAVTAEVYFEEGFKDDSWQKTWVQSEHKGVEYGKFVHTAGKFFNDAEADKGLQTSQDARFYALSNKFTPFSNKDDTLVVQFSVKHEQNIDCGGGYLKVFDCSVDQKDLHGETPYLLMFGPDICGPGTKKVHVIFSYKGVWVHPEIDNPEYVEDKTLYLREEVCAVGIDVWQVKSGTIFDNFLITNDLEVAKKAAATVKETQEGEKKVKDAQEAEERKKAEEEAAAEEANKDDDDEDDDDEEDNALPGEAAEVDDGHDEL